jgi:DNA-binding transcriptional ArsR family regulator
VDQRVELLKALAHPLRLGVVDRLGHHGPAPVSQLAVELGAALPELSNGLRRLRDAGIVVTAREGRQVVYALADDRLPALLDKLVATGSAPLAPPARPGPSRTCYDHLAGPLGVALYDALVRGGALRGEPDGTVSVTDDALLRALGVVSVPAGRRRLAFECLDATEHAAHLAGALGDALADALLARGWVERLDGREVRLTPAGEPALRELLAEPDFPTLRRSPPAEHVK